MIVSLHCQYSLYYTMWTTMLLSVERSLSVLFLPSFLKAASEIHFLWCLAHRELLFSFTQTIVQKNHISEYAADMIVSLYLQYSLYYTLWMTILLSDVRSQSVGLMFLPSFLIGSKRNPFPPIFGTPWIAFFPPLKPLPKKSQWLCWNMGPLQGTLQIIVGCEKRICCHCTVASKISGLLVV